MFDDSNSLVNSTNFGAENGPTPFLVAAATLTQYLTPFFHFFLFCLIEKKKNRERALYC